MNWTLLNPWALSIGAAALALPLAIHFLTRPRPIRVRYSTVRFLEEVLQQRRARDRLRDALILALRMLALLLLALALARPLGTHAALPDDAPRVDTTRVILLDVSQSMRAHSGGVELLERARAAAARHLERREGLRADLILAAAAPRPVFGAASPNVAALRDELRAVEARPERLAAQAALDQAAQLLAEAERQTENLELVVISDFQRTSWLQSDFSPLPARTKIILEAADEGAAAPNLAVLDVRTADRWQVAQPGRLIVEVGNFGAAARHADVEVTLGDATYRIGGPCPSGRTALSLEVTPRQTGWLAGQARILAATDALSPDDARHVAVEVRAAPTYLLVTRQPTGDNRTSSYFVERALAPLAGAGGASGERVVRISPDEINPQRLAEVDFVVIDHPGQLPLERLKLLAGLLRRGRGMLYVASEVTDAVNLKRLQEAVGSELAWPVEFLPASPRQPRRELFLIDVAAGRSPFRVFGDDLPGAIRPLRFAGGLDTRPVVGGLKDELLATLSDRSAALVMTTCGAGRVAVLNAELGASNLPLEAVFVPLVAELVRELSDQRGGTLTVACGETTALYLPPQVGTLEALEVAGPGDEATPPDGEFIEESGGVLWRLREPAAPGIYEVRRDGRTLFAVSAAAPPEESDLARVAPTEVQGRAAGGRAIEIRQAGQQPENADRLWTTLATACALCLLVEFGLLRWFRT